MIGLLVSLAAFFFIATMFQMTYLQRSISDVPSVVIPTAIPPNNSPGQPGINRDISAHYLDILAAMEAYLAERRYHQASISMMSGLWIRYLGFVTGMVLAIVGASFILGKLETSASELEGKGAGLEGSLKTASPGIILAALGVVLMLATIVNRDIYETHDGSIYLPSWGSAGVSLDTSTSQETPQPPTAIPLPTQSP